MNYIASEDALGIIVSRGTAEKFCQLKRILEPS